MLKINSESARSSRKAQLMFLGVVLSDEMIYSQMIVKVKTRSLNEFGFAFISSLKEHPSCIFLLINNYRSFRNKDTFRMKA